MPKQHHRLSILLWIVVFLSACSWARAVSIPASMSGSQDLAQWIRANYTKSEYQVPMRDGVRLFTAVYVPKDASSTNAYPILLRRTPYGIAPYGADQYPTSLGPSEYLALAKYIFVYQDVRGRFMSEGSFVDVRPEDAVEHGRAATDESTDAYDTIDWLVKNVPYNNGKVGMWGISYSGFYAAAGMLNAHPALKAVSPQAAVTDWFMGDDFHHNGALFLAAFFPFISAFGLPHPSTTPVAPERSFAIPVDGYEFFKDIDPLPVANERYLHHKIKFWDQVMQHPNYDSFWQSRNLIAHIRDIKPAVLDVGGWLDAEDLYGPLHIFAAAVKNSPSAQIHLVMGPWCHGCWSHTDGTHLGDISFGSLTGEFFRKDIEMPFFEHYLKNAPDPNLPVAYVFETGSNQWRKYDAWPPKQVTRKTLYLRDNGGLSFAPPLSATKAFDQYVSDPAKPVPYFDMPASGQAAEYMDGDDRLQGRRTDVLVYQTDPLPEDVTLAGPVRPILQVSTTGTDADWIVKLIDVYPSDSRDAACQAKSQQIQLCGYQELVRGEPMRGRFRNGFGHPEPFVPGQRTRVEFVMPDINHMFRRGHRIMVQVQSSWFPLVDINPQTFVDIYTAQPRDFRTATMRVYHSSQIQVFVLSQRRAP